MAISIKSGGIANGTIHVFDLVRKDNAEQMVYMDRESFEFMVLLWKDIRTMTDEDFIRFVDEVMQRMEA